MKIDLSFFKSSNIKYINRTYYYYVIINVGLSAFSFLRSFVFMRYLDLKELGVISLVQTIFMFIGLLQMGLLNGGYRIISLGKKDEMERTNNVIYTYLFLLLPLGLVFCVLSSLFNWIDELSFPLLVISVIFGVFTLLNNWYHNVLIGEQKLTEVNRSNIFSYSFAALLLPLAYFFGFWGGMVVIMAQPLAFVAISVLRNRELFPTKFCFDTKYIKYILSFGFIPFLGGIFSSIYQQLERWSITEVLSVEALGGFYLVFLYVSLYELVPNSINSIFFPKGVKAYSEKRYIDFKSILKYYFIVLFAYGIIITIVTFLFLEPVVTLVFPMHVPGVKLVYIILPGLILQSLSQPVGLVLNSSVILRPMLIVSSSNLLFNAVAFVLLIVLGVFTLQSVALLRAISGAYVFIAYILVYYIIRKKLYII